MDSRLSVRVGLLQRSASNGTQVFTPLGSGTAATAPAFDTGNTVGSSPTSPTVSENPGDRGLVVESSFQ
jgi:hypothetical protein